jgi:hypothetical protein
MEPLKSFSEFAKFCDKTSVITIQHIINMYYN